MTAGTATIPVATAGDFLRKAREFAGLTQAELAALLALDSRTVRDHERDVRPTRPERVAAWANATGVDPTWLQWNVDACNTWDMRPDFDLRARRDSNPKPSDWEPAIAGFVNDGLTPEFADRSGWVLAA